MLLRLRLKYFLIFFVSLINISIFKYYLLPIKFKKMATKKKAAKKAAPKKAAKKAAPKKAAKKAAPKKAVKKAAPKKNPGKISGI